MQPFSGSIFSLALLIGGIGQASAGDVHVGGPVTKNGMEIVANYLLGVAMEPMPKGQKGQILVLVTLQ